jgi:hypothetical protein
MINWGGQPKLMMPTPSIKQAKYITGQEMVKYIKHIKHNGNYGVMAEVMQCFVLAIRVSLKIAKK